ncbi:MAG: hypothetical protein JSU65_11910 [Candidatus Zixiibacteriota bacterium]|nr:MAG: hypothetical protein JSU65_11910 [candidate division Zixibacteria bacterium]
MMACKAPHVPYIRGNVETYEINDTVVLNYDFRVKRRGIDSIALQVTPVSSWTAWNKAVDSLVDSILKSRGDSIPLCNDACIGCLRLSLCRRPASDSNYCDSIIASLDPPVCWWSLMGRVGVDSVLATTPIGMLRLMSIPRSWLWERLEQLDEVVDSNMQADSIIYRKVDGVKYPQVRGSLRYTTRWRLIPQRYWVRVYSTEFGGRSRYLYGLPMVWDDLFPKTPVSERFEFTEQGNGLGGFFAIGGGKLSRAHLPSPLRNRYPIWGGNCEIGFSYYATKRIYDIGFRFRGHEGGADDTLRLYETSIPAVHHYLGKRVMSGLSVLTALELSELQLQQGSTRIGREEWGVQLGLGYDTHFDRLTYSYHTVHGGYHHLELLVGYQAIQQGKVGLKLSVRYGELVRTSSLQFYMQNRVDPTTMALRNPRTLVEQLLMYAGMTAIWALIG